MKKLCKDCSEAIICRSPRCDSCRDGRKRALYSAAAKIRCAERRALRLQASASCVDCGMETTRGDLYRLGICFECRAERKRKDTNARQKKYYWGHREKVLARTKEPEQAEKRRQINVRLAKTPERIAYQAAYRAKNRKECNARTARWLEDEENREYKRAKDKIWRDQHREHRRKKDDEWRVTNPDKSCAKTAKYNASKMKACPPWANLNQIAFIYAEAQRMTRETGIEHHVDHIYPLQSKVLCGLHIPLNLQILSRVENQSKSNRKWPGNGLPELEMRAC